MYLVRGSINPLALNVAAEGVSLVLNNIKAEASLPCEYQKGIPTPSNPDSEGFQKGGPKIPLA
jgi:hypothetical protein